MSNRSFHEAENLDQLQTAAEKVFLANFHSGKVPEARSDLRDLLRLAYSIGYDAAHQDHVDGNLG